MHRDPIVSFFALTLALACCAISGERAQSEPKLPAPPPATDPFAPTDPFRKEGEPPQAAEKPEPPLMIRVAPPRIEAPETEAERKAVRAKLEVGLTKKVDLVAAEKPLNEVVQSLSTQAGIPIAVDEKSLRDIGIEPMTPITLTLKGVSLRAALAHLLLDFDCDWCIRERALLVTTTMGTNARLETQIYAAADLLDAPRPPSPFGPQEDPLFQEIQFSVAPPTWGQVGGPGSLARCGPAMIVSQTPQVQAQVADLMNHLRRSRASRTKWDRRTRPIPDLPAQGGWHSEDPQEIAWGKTRRRPITLSFAETPLAKVVEVLEEKTGFPFRLHQRSLADAQRNLEEPISFACEELPLEEALQKMLAVPQFRFRLWQETVQIGVGDDFSEPQTWVFPVYDVAEGDGTALVNELQSLFPPANPEEGISGPLLSYFPPAGALIAYLPTSDMRRIAEKLADLRKKGSLPVASAPEPATESKEWVTRTYLEPDGMEQALALYEAQFAQQGTPGLPRAEIARVVRAFIEPESWDRHGLDARMDVEEGRLLVRHRPEVHARIAPLIAELKASYPGFATVEARPKDQPLTGEFAADLRDARAALDREVTCSLKGPRLPALLSNLGEQARIAIELDPAVPRGGFDLNRVVPVPPGKRRLASLLHHVVKDLELAWRLREGKILITRRDTAIGAGVPRPYWIGDLVRLDDEKDTYRDVAALLAAAFGGSSELVDEEAGILADLGTVRQPRIIHSLEGHAQLETFFAAVRQAREGKLAWNGSDRRLAKAPEQVGWRIGGRMEAWEEARLQRVTLRAIEIPLDEFLAELSLRTGIHFRLDDPALKEIGIERATPITKEFQEEPLEKVMRGVLRDLDLTLVVWNEAILITTPEKANSQLETWIYPVFDLGTDDSPDGLIELDPSRTSLSDLRNSLVDLIAPQTWEEYGGPASISYYSPAGALIVCHTAEVHEEIGDLLTKLRAALPAAPRDRAEIADAWITRVHRLPFRPAAWTEQDQARIAAHLRTIEPSSWSNAEVGGRSLFLQDRLVVRQKLRVHQEIAAYLRSLGSRKKME